MRFIAKYAKYTAYARNQVTEAYATGATKIIQNQLVAAFSITEVSGDERALARQHFRFNGFFQEQDLVTIVEPDYRISAFDSRKAQAENGWSDEEREIVERTLIALAENYPQDVMRIEERRAVAPWPTYDTFGGNRNQLLKKISDDGFDLAEVLAYERENQNREEIVELMESVLNESDDSPAAVMEEELVG